MPSVLHVLTSPTGSGSARARPLCHHPGRIVLALTACTVYPQPGEIADGADNDEQLARPVAAQVMAESQRDLDEDTDHRA